MTYTTTKEIRIHHDEDNWHFFFSTDEYGSINVSVIEGNDRTAEFDIPRDCIRQFIAPLEELK
jgi:hypothetical protein